jgi:hypothetical protein
MRRKSVKQRDVTASDIKPGLAIEFDNGDKGWVEKDWHEKYALEVSSDGINWGRHGIPLKSRHVMACLIYVYPSEEL